MFRFLVAFVLVFAALLAWACIAEGNRFQYDRYGAAWLAALLVGLPGVAAWGVAEVVDKVRPRRVFDPRVNRPWVLVFSGLAAGVIGVVAAAPLLALVDKLNDAVSLAAGAVVGSGVVLLMLRRKRAGECVQCGYDLSGAVEPRCSECGAMHSVV